MNTLNKRVQHLEGDLEMCEDKMLLATQKLDKVTLFISENKMSKYSQAVTAADDSDRMRKVFESKASGVSNFG